MSAMVVLTTGHWLAVGVSRKQRSQAVDRFPNLSRFPRGRFQASPRGRALHRDLTSSTPNTATRPY